ncbi:o-succinylbenzoate synthase [Algoriphagus hitonicola]|uniref:O-succinylbenzoate synthase n=1 Tax=Algoriphagus hitonicola TaxID=435880 RepID=A0A1I2XDH3_9BACT|nr:o-succinylbenzoate synthase [Algoriphagus hitonicola]SFH11584.1 o-succinylbenzoate synthase [Algoriphagus hitonicola]
MKSTRLKFDFFSRTLNFRFEAGTSRGVLKSRKVWWISAINPESAAIGWGEAAPLVKLSIDDRPDFEEKLKNILTKAEDLDWSLEENEVLDQVEKLVSWDLPSIRFGLEMAVLDWISGGKKRFFENDFRDEFKPIPINGLIWMGDRQFMLDQIEQKLSEGFDCIKMKIGAIDFEQELELLSTIRSNFSAEQIMLRVDANGAFQPDEALEKLQKLADLKIHSIEQPIRAGQWDEMARLCEITPIPIALDEELIGVREKELLLDRINPQHIILKPTLLGGFRETTEWIRLAENRKIGWWVTSTLESNIGLNAIAQLASFHQSKIHQGLGTGKLYHNNLQSPLSIEKGHIRYQDSVKWENPY